MSEDLFGELRSLLSHRPDVEIWDRLCAFVAWIPPEEFVDRYLPYLESQLARWPDWIRRTPRNWLLKGMAGNVGPRLRLVRNLMWTYYFPPDKRCRILENNPEFSELRILHMPLDEDIEIRTLSKLSLPELHAVHLECQPDLPLHWLNESDGLGRWTTLDLTVHELDEALLCLNSPRRESLRSLRLQTRSHLSQEDLRLLIKTPAFRGLELLALFLLRDDGLEGLLESHELHSLRTLILTGSGITDEGLRTLGSSRSLDHLEHLVLEQSILSRTFLDERPSISLEGLDKLAHSDALPFLRRLTFTRASDPDFEDEARAIFAHSALSEVTLEFRSSRYELAPEELYLVRPPDRPTTNTRNKERPGGSRG